MENQIDNQDPVEICPNCMEPNAAGQTNCVYCGMSMHAGENAENATQELSVDTSVAGTSAEADSSASAKPQPKKQNKGFTYAMRGMGIYLIVYAISEIPRSLKLEKQQDRTLSLVSNVIYLIAGAMIAWPMLKEYLDKRKKAQSGEIEEETSPASEMKEIIEGEIVDQKSVDKASDETDSGIFGEDFSDDEEDLRDPEPLDGDFSAGETRSQR